MKRLRRPFEEEYLVEFGTGGSDFSMNGVVVHPLPEHWDEIVELYTDTNLTRPEDKLVAISGLAREIQKDTKDIYYAGLWGKDFERTLLWYIQMPQRTESWLPSPKAKTRALNFASRYGPRNQDCCCQRRRISQRMNIFWLDLSFNLRANFGMSIEGWEPFGLGRRVGRSGLRDRE
jgi:hypothetical protein